MANDIRCKVIFGIGLESNPGPLVARAYVLTNCADKVPRSPAGHAHNASIR